MSRRRAAHVALTALAALLLAASCGGGTTTHTPEPDPAADGDGLTPRQEARARRLLAPVRPGDPGCAVAVRRGDDLVWADAAGQADLDSGEPITADTLFDIGSTSKLFTATLILDLVATGDLALDDTVADHLDGLPPWASVVTVDQLLHHTAAIPDYIDLLYDQGYVDADRTTVEDAFDALRGVDLEGQRGGRFAYSNSGYFLLAEIAAAVTGQDPAEAMAERVFARHDLDAVLDPVPDDPRRAHSYLLEAGFWEDADSAWEQVGDGAVQTTPVELVRWASELWDPRHPPSVTRDRLDDAVDDDEGTRYGAGVIIDPFGPLGTTLGHDGAWAGFVADLLVVPERELAAAVTCNTPDLVDPTTVAERLLDLAAR